MLVNHKPDLIGEFALRNGSSEYILNCIDTFMENWSKTHIRVYWQDSETVMQMQFAKKMLAINLHHTIQN